MVKFQSCPCYDIWSSSQSSVLSDPHPHQYSLHLNTRLRHLSPVRLESPSFLSSRCPDDLLLVICLDLLWTNNNVKCPTVSGTDAWWAVELHWKYHFEVNSGLGTDDHFLWNEMKRKKHQRQKEKEKTLRLLLFQPKNEIMRTVFKFSVIYSYKLRCRSTEQSLGQWWRGWSPYRYHNPTAVCAIKIKDSKIIIHLYLHDAWT